LAGLRPHKQMTWREKARRLKQDVVAPWYAKALGACVIAYALSPIDLIPDFVPVVGYLDDLVLVPLGLLLLLRLIPAPVMAEHRAAAAELAQRPVSYAGAAGIVVIWLAVLAVAAYAMARYFAG
jgi:uncharacterized membrane protein YkvA (DUF1232 family)